MDSAHPRITGRQGDALLAVALSVALVLELSLGANITGPFWANYVLGLFVTGAVAFRRPLPVYMLGLELLSVVISTAAGGDLVENPVSPFLAVIVTSYAVGAYAPAGWDVFGLVIGVIGILLLRVAGNEGAVGDYIATELLSVIGPWFAGRVAREWAQRALELQRVNAALKAEQE